jgi:hypothetical protein
MGHPQGEASTSTGRSKEPTHEACRIAFVSTDLAIDGNKTLHHNSHYFTVREGILQSVPQHNHKWQAFPLLMRSRWWFWGLSQTHSLCTMSTPMIYLSHLISQNFCMHCSFISLSIAGMVATSLNCIRILWEIMRYESHQAFPQPPQKPSLVFTGLSISLVGHMLWFPYHVFSDFLAVANYSTSETNHWKSSNTIF